MVAAAFHISNHRHSDRLYQPMPVFVRGVSEQGLRIKIHASTDNISVGGLFLHLPYRLALGASLFTFTQLPGSACLAAMGRIVRTERKEPGITGIAVCFSNTRLLPPHAG